MENPRLDSDSRRRTEIDFFDAFARTVRVTPVDRNTVARYAGPVGPWGSDFAYGMAAPLTGKRVLDVGAGTGDDSLVLAALGAQVTAMDISSASLEVLERRAELSGLHEHITTVVAPLEDLADETRYDIVWVNGFLHHVIPILPSVLAILAGRLAGKGRIIMQEPACPAWLRRVRLLLPVGMDGTPGERPLHAAELRQIKDAFPDLRVRRFYGLSRLSRFTERAPRVLARLDRHLLRLPGLAWLGGTVVMWADAPNGGCCSVEDVDG